MPQRIVLIGQAPGPKTDPEFPLFPIPKTSAAGRLRDIAGLSMGQYLRAFDRINLIREFPGQTSCKEDRFPMAKARENAALLRPLLAGRDVILVGRNVATAFGLGGLEFLSWKLVKMTRPAVPGDQHTSLVAIIAHPSGRNHWYNNDGHREATRQFMQSALADRDLLSFARKSSMSGSSTQRRQDDDNPEQDGRDLQPDRP